IEIVNRITGTHDPYSDWQVEMTVQIVRYAWAKYPNLRHVVSHAKLDPERRSDPGPLFPWDDFRERVLAAPAAGSADWRARFTMHPELPASDINRAATWYREKLGLQPTRHGIEPVQPGSTSFDSELLYETGRARFGVYESPSAGNNDATAARIVVDDFAAVRADLLARGVVFEDFDLGPDFRTVDGVLVSDDGEQTAWFRDSEGNLVAIGSST
ncbi:MAG: hypothetical protein AAGK32_21410, partial [Actinomycetota bacterium]